jgi:hypothetical protein
MARKRFIDPSFWTDTAISKLKPLERLFFLGCVSNADDEGRLPGNPAFLRSIIFPYDDLSIDEIRSIRDNVAATCKNLIVYVVDGDEFIAFRQWRRYQSPRYPQPSHYPAPPEVQCEQPNGDDSVKPVDTPLTQDCNCEVTSLTQSCVNDVTMGSGRDEVGDEVQVRDQVGGSSRVEPKARGQPVHPPDATERERLILHELSQVERYPIDLPKDLGHIRTIAVDFPTIDMLSEIKRWRAWLIDHPLTKKSNPRLRLRNWCEIAAKRQSERGDDRNGRGSPSQKGTQKPGKYDDLVIRA